MNPVERWSFGKMHRAIIDNETAYGAGVALEEDDDGHRYWRLFTDHGYLQRVTPADLRRVAALMELHG